MAKRCVIKMVSASFLALSSMGAQGGQVTQANDRVEINWSRMRVQFYGVAANDAAEKKELREVESAAWIEGLRYIKTHMKGVQLNQGVEKSHANDIADKISKSTYSTNTTYVAKGRGVKVDLEAALPQLFTQPDAKFAVEKAPSISNCKNSGILLRISGQRSPAATFKVVDEDGEVLVQLSNIAKESYNRNLMGRWFKAGNVAEQQRFIGKNPVALDVVVKGEALVVDRQAWETALKENEALVQSSKIALILSN